MLPKDKTALQEALTKAIDDGRKLLQHLNQSDARELDPEEIAEKVYEVSDQFFDLVDTANDACNEPFDEHV